MSKRDRYIGGLIGAGPIVNGSPRAGVSNLGSLGGDVEDGVADEHFDNVALLLDGDGTNGQTTFTDKSNSPLTVTAFDNAQVDTSVKKFGTGSIKFDGASDYLTVEGSTGVGAFGTDDFTLEMWIYATAANNDSIFENRPSGANAATGFTLVAFNSSTINFWSGGGNRISATGLTWLNGWHHLAITRESGTTTLWFDGESKGTTTYSALMNMTDTSDVIIGAGRYSGTTTITSTSSVFAYMDEIRITKGVARYSADFSANLQSESFPTTATAVSSNIRPTRRWGGMLGRSIVTPGNSLIRSGILSLPEMMASIEKFGATGGDNTFEYNGYKYHEFLSDGTLTITGSGTFDVLLVGGGGAGGRSNAGGGGGGEVIIGTGLSVSDVATINVTVGAGGAGSTTSQHAGLSGTLSSISASGLLTTIEAKPGAGGSGRNQTATNTSTSNGGGGPDGKGSIQSAAAQTGHSVSSYSNENSGSYTIYGGNTGGNGVGTNFNGGGGGAGANGDGGTVNGTYFSDGGPGIQVTGWGATDYYYGGGGGGSTWSGQTVANAGDGGLGGGGGGGASNTGSTHVSTSGDGDTNGRNNGIDGQGSTDSNSSATGGDAGDNTGGGGGGGAYESGQAGAGGSGIVVIRYTV